MEQQSVSAINILYIIIAGGFLGFFMTRILSSKVNIKTSILNALHKFKSKQMQGNLDVIESKQNTIKVKLTKDTNISEQTKDKIKVIQKKAAKDIEEILKEENISKIHQEVDKEWQNI